MQIKFRNLDIEVTLEKDLPIPTFLLTMDTQILRHNVISTYYRPFTAYRQSGRFDKDLEAPTRETGDMNEYFYYLNYLLRSPNAPERSKVKIRANNLLYVLHDLLHSFHDIVGDTGEISKETEVLRLKQAMYEGKKLGIEPFPDELLEHIHKMFAFDQAGDVDQVELDLIQYNNEFIKHLK